MQPKIRTFDYMKRFKCIGPDCEDTCCNGWTVGLNSEDYRKISALMKNRPELKPYREFLVPGEKSILPGVAGSMGCGPQGCGLQDHGWCRLHRDYGEKMIPTICATYPRHIVEHRDHWEIQGRLSCPEVARLCLLSPTTPTLCDDDEHRLPVIYETSDWLTQGKDFYRQQMERVSAVIRAILALPNYGTREKSYFLLYFISKIDAFFHQDAQPEVEHRLERQLHQATDPGTLAKIAGHLDAVQPDQSPARHLLLALLNARLKGPQYTRYNQLLTRILRTYGKPGTQLGEQGVTTSREESEKLWTDFLVRRKTVLAAFPTRIEQYFANFAVFFWTQLIFLGDRSLLIPARKWLLYLALLRFLYLSHPDVLAAAESGKAESEGAAVLDGAIVELVQTFMKTIDANRTMQTSFLTAMEPLGFTNMTRLTELLSV